MRGLRYLAHVSKRHRKQRAEQHIARRRRDQIPDRRTLSRAGIVLLSCSAAAAAILFTVAIVGVPSNTAARYGLLALFVAAALTFLHTLVMRVLPVSKRRDRRAPGISERGIAPGVSPMPGPIGGIDIHLTEHRDN